MAPYRRTTRVARLAIAAAVTALVLGIAANTGTALQAYRNCQNIEKVKDRIRQVLGDSIINLESGGLDKQYQQLYGAAWVQAKEDAIENAHMQIDRFQPDRCSFFIH